MKKVIFIGASLLVLNEAAFANKIKKFSLKAPEGYSEAAVVKVYSTNGEKWNKIDQTQEVNFKAQLNAECKYEGKGNKAYKGDFTVSGFTQVGADYPAKHLIPHVKETKGTFRFDKNSNFDFVQACNVELEKKLSENADLTKYDILAKGFSLNYPAAVKASYYLTCKPTGIGFADTSSKSVLLNTKIQCQGSDLAKEKIPKKPVPVKSVKLANLIKKVEFAPKVKHIVGTCPAQVEYNGAITTNRFGTVEYQYVSHDGRKSPKFKLDFNKAGTKKLRVWKRTINKEDDPNAFRAGSSNKDKYDYKGWYRIDILNPKGIKSIQKAYTLSCQDRKMMLKK